MSLVELLVIYTPTLGVLVTFVLFWPNHYWLHNNIGLTFSLSRIKEINMSSPTSTKNNNNEDDDGVPQTEEKGDKDKVNMSNQKPEFQIWHYLLFVALGRC
jgi:hypothetical protein